MSGTILTPGCNTNIHPQCGCGHTHWESPNETHCPAGAPLEYLLKQNYLSEFTTSIEKENARANLNVNSTEEVTEEIETAIENHMNNNNGDPHGTIEKVELILEDFVKKDGSTPFTAPQKGMPALAKEDLVTKEQIDNLFYTYTTIGPTDYTVGGLPSGSILPNTISFKDLIDMFLYGSGVLVETPGVIPITTNPVVNVTMTIKGPKHTITSINLFQNDIFIGSFNPYNFTYNNSLTVSSLVLSTNSTTFRLEVSYSDGTMKVSESVTLIQAASYIGLLPKSKYDTDINGIDQSYINSLISSDPINNSIMYPQISVENNIDYIQYIKQYNMIQVY